MNPRWGMRHLSLRARLMLLALLSMAPVLAVDVYLAWVELQEANRKALHELGIGVDRMQQRMQLVLGHAQSVGEAIGSLAESASDPNRGCGEALRAAAQYSDYVTNFALATPGGEVRCSASPVSVPVSLADRPYFQEAIATGRIAVSGYFLDRITGQGTLMMAIPHLGPAGTVTSVAVAAFDSANLVRGIEQLGHIPVTAALIDRDGIIASHWPVAPDASPGADASQTEMFRRARAGERGAIEVPSSSGRQDVHVVRPVVYRGATVAWVSAGTDLHAMQLAAVDLVAVPTLLAVLAALAVAGLGALLGRPMVLSRCREMLRVAREVTSGRFDARVDSSTHDELTVVEGAINKMLDALASDRAALADSESRYRLLFEHSHDGVLLVDPGGAVVAANASACALLGSCPDRLGALEGMRGDAGLHAAVERVIAAGEQIAVELETPRADGARLQLELTASRYADHTGLPHACVILRDVSERKRTEREIRALNRDLERRIQGRTRELQVANKDLEAFSYSLSHDLRGPVAVVTSFSAILLEKAAALDAKGRHFLDRIHASGRRMNELIEAMLSLAGIGRARLNVAPVDVSAMAGEIAQECRDRDPEHPVQFAVEPGITVLADPGMLRIALQNLLSNAWKFTRGIAHPAVKVVRGEGAGHDVCVTDNGIGFDPAHAERLFKPFQRLHTDAEYPGLGIGLATVQRVVERHDGMVDCRSMPGAGASFCLRLSRTRSSA